MAEQESELYAPVAAWFISANYAVMAEVKSCDVIAVRDGGLTVIELKLKPSLKLIYQLTARARCADFVYAALPFDAVKSTQKRQFLGLLRRLGIGLLWIRESRLGTTIKEALVAKPQPRGGPKDKRLRSAILKEFATRQSDQAVGGQVSIIPLVTAYRENVLITLALLEIHGECSPSKLRELGAPSTVGRILIDNHDHWFERKRRGIYAHTATSCESAHQKFPEAWQAALDRARQRG